MSEITYHVNGKSVRVKTSNFTGTKSIDEYVKEAYNALSKIGVDRQYIDIDAGGYHDNAYAEVKWEINGKKFSFRCDRFKHQYKNMGAIAQVIQDDVRHITRGIKSLWASMEAKSARRSCVDCTTSIVRTMESSRRETNTSRSIYRGIMGSWNPGKTRGGLSGAVLKSSIKPLNIMSLFRDIKNARKRQQWKGKYSRKRFVGNTTRIMG